MDQEWIAFCDAAEIAPDTLESAAVLAERYRKMTGIYIASREITKMRGVSEGRITEQRNRWARIARNVTS